MKLKSSSPNKYRNQATYRGHRRFDSKAEARRYDQLILLLQAGEIQALQLQPEFVLHVKDQKIGKYVADFSYLDQAGHHVVEDVKGVETALFKWKRKHLLAEHQIDVQVIRMR